MRKSLSALALALGLSHGLAVAVAVLVAMGLFLTGCPATDDQISRTLTAHGMTLISDDGVAILGCAEGDAAKTAVTARSAHGERVRAVVCCGGYLPISKGCTLRVMP